MLSAGSGLQRFSVLQFSKCSTVSLQQWTAVYMMRVSLVHHNSLPPALDVCQQSTLSIDLFKMLVCVRQPTADSLVHDA